MHFSGIVLCGVLAALANASKVVLKDNGYENILVSISEKATRNQADEIIRTIKRMFTDASPILHVATDEKAYFRSVHILIPESWNHIDANASTWENYKSADIIVDDPEYASNEIPRPYVRQPGECGEPGQFMHFSLRYLEHAYADEQIRKVGTPGKVLVHEWAHYRYGVFDEYGSPGDSKYPLFYIPRGTSKIVPNLCFNKAASFTLVDISTNERECKIDPETQVYDENCRFHLNEQFAPDTSLASLTSLDSITKFCQEDQNHRHVYDAPNKHNDKCSAFSVMSVIMRNQDFQNAQKSQKQDEVQFHIVRATPETTRNKFVLVVDLSFCMKRFDRFKKLQEAARNWIKYDLPTGSELGIVAFSSVGHIISELTIVTDETRDTLISKIPSKLLSHRSCIGCGLSLGAQLLNETGYGGVLVLITDSIEDGYIRIGDVQQDIIAAGVRVVTITFGQEANPVLEKLADMTDGKSYLTHDYETCEAVEDAFVDSITLQHSVPTQDFRVKLYEEIFPTKQNNKIIEDQFDVDTGRNLQLRVVHLDNSTNVESIKLIGPNERFLELPFNKTGTTALTTVSMIEEGRWYYTVRLNREQSNPILISITAQSHPDAESPISTRCWVPNGAYIAEAETKAIKVYAEVMKGCNPVLGAKVQAYIEKPDGTIEILELLDDGKGADGESNDGLYSRYFTKATQSGRYSVRCQVFANQTAYVAFGFIGSRAPRLQRDTSHALLPHKDSNIIQEAPLTPFSRMITGGSFQLERPVSELDAYPPGRVSDLSARLINWTIDSATVHLTWTAPGDELDYGIVTKYEMKYAFDVTELLGDKFDDSDQNWPLLPDSLLAGSFDPVEAGTPQEVFVFLTNVEKSKPYFIGLRALDKASKSSKVSNMATVFVPDSRPSAQIKSSAGTGELFGNDQTLSKPDTRPQGILTGVAIGIFLSLILFGSLIVFVAFLVRRISPYKSLPSWIA